YQECRFVVINRNPTRSRLVQLTFPADHHRVFETHIRAVSKTFEVAPEASVRVALYVPAFPAAVGSNVAVAIDGKAVETRLPYALRTVDTSHRYSFSPGSIGAHDGELPLVLLGPSLRARGWREAEVKKVSEPVLVPGAPAPGPAGGPPV